MKYAESCGLFKELKIFGVRRKLCPLVAELGKAVGAECTLLEIGDEKTALCWEKVNFLMVQP